LSPNIGSEIGSVFSLAAFAYVARITMMNMASPVRSAFSMEILSPQERGTQVGIQLALTSVVSGTATFFGARMMEAGDFQTPFYLMAIFYSISSFLFWHFFAGREEELLLDPPISKPNAVPGED
jgi:MFS family permease